MKIFSNKESTFDWWSLIHFGLYGWIGSSIEALWKPNWWIHAIWLTLLTVGWELLEGWAEKQYPDKFRSKCEHWSNRWVGDPISNSLGAIFGIWVVGR